MLFKVMSVVGIAALALALAPIALMVEAAYWIGRLYRRSKIGAVYGGDEAIKNPQPILHSVSIDDIGD